ncbi:MAG TPA: hypothetical protein P5560_12695 [Thermotogota bacterium]|nr:hypothetical protein [Thermotogota bacterium]
MKKITRRVFHPGVFLAIALFIALLGSCYYVNFDAILHEVRSDLESGDYDGAIEKAQEAFQKAFSNWNKASLHALVGWAHWMKNDPGQASASFDRALGYSMVSDAVAGRIALDFDNRDYQEIFSFRSHLSVLPDNWSIQAGPKTLDHEQVSEIVLLCCGIQGDGQAFLEIKASEQDVVDPQFLAEMEAFFF